MSTGLVDRLLQEPAIVFGSLPPGNRDLDLLLSAAEYGRLGTELDAQGWITRDRHTWVRVAEGTAFAVDLVVLDQWVPNATVAALLREAALPLEGYAHLGAPAAHHRLLLLARRHRQGMGLTERKRTTLEGFSDEDWTHAAIEADVWELQDAVAELRLHVDRVSTPARGGPGPIAALRRRLRGARRQRIISLSGLDGAGKSTQGEYLRAALAALGYDARVEWTKIARDPVLDKVARPIKRLLRRVGGDAPPAPVELVDASGEHRNHPNGPRLRDGASRRREKSAVLTWCWTLVVAWANAATHRRTARGARSGVVICDRYVLDSAAHLRYRYGPHARFRVQREMIRLLSPTPACAVLLDISAATARQRKPEQYTTADLTRLRRLYHEEARGLGVLVIDGERDQYEVAAEIAREAWFQLDDS